MARREETVEELREQRANAARRIERLEQNLPKDEIGDAFHLGRVGGSGGPVKTLDKRRARALDRTIDLSRELVPLYDEIARLDERIRDIESGAADRRRAAREEADKRMLAWFEGLKVGDEVPMGNGSIRVVKKNRKSVITQGGVKWTRQELTGVWS